MVVGSAPAGADLSDLLAVASEVVATPKVQNTALVRRGRHLRRLAARARATLLPLPTVRASYSPAIARLVSDACAHWHPDVAHLEGFYALHYAPPGMPAVLSLHDVFSRVAAEARDAHPVRFALAPLQMGAYERVERQVLPTMALVLTISPQDELELEGRDIRAHSVPFAVPVADQPAPPPTGGPTRLLFVGTFESLPNRMAARFIEQRLLPALDARGLDFTMTLAGRRAAPQSACAGSRQNVRYVADADSLDGLYAAAQVVLAPLTYGGGVKTKTLEAMAFARPVVGTRVAFTGLAPDAAAGVLAIDLHAGRMAQAVCALAGDERQRLAMGRAGHTYVQTCHSQQRVAESLLGFYDAIA